MVGHSAKDSTSCSLLGDMSILLGSGVNSGDFSSCFFFLVLSLVIFSHAWADLGSAEDWSGTFCRSQLSLYVAVSSPAPCSVAILASGFPALSLVSLPQWVQVFVGLSLAALQPGSSPGWVVGPLVGLISFASLLQDSQVPSSSFPVSGLHCS